MKRTKELFQQEQERKPEWVRRLELAEYYYNEWGGGSKQTENGRSVADNN